MLFLFCFFFFFLLLPCFHYVNLLQSFQFAQLFGLMETQLVTMSFICTLISLNFQNDASLFEIFDPTLCCQTDSIQMFLVSDRMARIKPGCAFRTIRQTKYVICDLARRDSFSQIFFTPICPTIRHIRFSAENGQ